MHYLRLLRVFVATSFLAELQYRANFGVQAVQTVVSLGTSAAGLAIIFSNTTSLGGWSAPEMVALLGVYFFVGSFLGIVLQPSMQRLMDDVRLGTLDFTLTKPGDAQFLVSFRQIQVWRITDALLGIALLVGAMLTLGRSVGFFEAGSFLLVLVTGSIVIYSFYLMLATFTFWVIRVENILVIFNSVYHASGQYPVGIYPPWLRSFLTFVVPVAFATTVPVEALSSRLTYGGLVGAVALAVLLFAASRMFWRFGLRSYTGASA